MFAFSDPSPQILESNIAWGEAEEKYPDKFMIVINPHFESSGLYGDIIAILTPDEYSLLEKPKPMAPRYNVWRGLKIKYEGLGALDFYL